MSTPLCQSGEFRKIFSFIKKMSWYQNFCRLSRTFPPFPPSLLAVATPASTPPCFNQLHRYNLSRSLVLKKKITSHQVNVISHNLIRRALNNSEHWIIIRLQVFPVLLLTKFVENLQFGYQTWDLAISLCLFALR